MNSLSEPKKWEKLFWPLVALAVFLALWHYSVMWTATKVFPSPLAVLKGIGELARKGLLWRYTGDSLRRVGLGFGAAAVLGIPLGIDAWLVSSREPSGESSAANAAAHQPDCVDSSLDHTFRRG